MSSSIDDASSAIYKTLEQIYGSAASTNGSAGSLSYAVWNDESPTGKTISGGGHTKGALAADSKTGFWLIQSLPKFPDMTSLSDMWSKSAPNFGQHYLCITMTSEDINTVAGQYLIAQPQVFASGNGANLANVAALISSKWSSESSKIQNFNAAGLNLTHFIKSPKWGKDLYEDLVQPELRVSAGFAWETWRRSPFMDAYCPPTYTYPSVNVEDCTVGGLAFSYANDHSKYGVSLDSSEPWVCVGDINRMASQFARGGGTLCFKDENFYTAMKGCVSKADSC